MNRSIKTCLFLFAFFFIVSPVLLRLPQAQAFSYYKYVDKNGNTHYTDNMYSIPENYRTQIKEYSKKETPQPALSTRQQVTAMKSDPFRKTEEKKAAEEKVQEEKLAQEEKQREREEIQDRLAGVQEKIKGKQEEIGNLGALWNVFNRNKVNQLNSEIATLGVERNVLQQELADKE